MCARVSKKLQKAAECYSEIVDELHRRGKISLSLELYDIVTSPLKRAARKVGLKVNRGKIYTKNNKNGCNVLLFPIDIELIPVDIPVSELCIWKRVVCASAVFPANRCRLELIDVIINLKYEVDFYEECVQKYRIKGVAPLSKEAFFKLQNAYGESLRIIGIGSVSHGYMVRGWNTYEPMNYFCPSELSAFQPEMSECENRSTGPINDRKPVRAMEPVAKVASSFEYVFMAATLFSLCKALFLRYNIKANSKFSLQIEIKSTSEAEGAWKQMFLGQFADMWCNYRDWNDCNEENSVGSKFWHKNGIAGVIFAPWDHLNFPLVFSDCSRLTWGDDIESQKIVDFLSKREVCAIGETSCLPLLLPLRKSEKPYPQKDCLKLIWNPANDRDEMKEMIARFEPTDPTQKKLSRRHREIMRFYVAFLETLNDFIQETHTKKAIAKQIRQNYKEALLDLGAVPAKATLEQQEKACLLGSLYLARDMMGESRYGGDISTAIDGVKKYLGRDVMLEDFAAFVCDCLRQNSKYREAFFYQDQDGIYLFYNKYWETFQKYCDSNGIIISCGAAAFRRNVLEKYISPQYDPSNPRKYPRYDYRKKVDGQKAVVLKVSSQILKLKQA